MAENFRLSLIQVLVRENRTCSDEEIQTVVNSFGKYLMYEKTYPNTTYYFTDQKGVKSTGFYLAFLKLYQHETEPTRFFNILEIDSKIGWVNPEHLEKTIFYFKAIRIIKDEQVS